MQRRSPGKTRRFLRLWCIACALVGVALWGVIFRHTVNVLSVSHSSAEVRVDRDNRDNRADLAADSLQTEAKQQAPHQDNHLPPTDKVLSPKKDPNQTDPPLRWKLDGDRLSVISLSEIAWDLLDPDLEDISQYAEPLETASSNDPEPCRSLFGLSYQDLWQIADGGGVCAHSSFLGATHCGFGTLRLDLDLVSSAPGIFGGEDPESDTTRNQAEDAEYLDLHAGALSSGANPPSLSSILKEAMSSGKMEPSTTASAYPNHLSMLRRSLATPHSPPSKSPICQPQDLQLPGATLLVQRYEYANLFHTTTDWLHALHAEALFGLSRNNTRALFLDAHAAGALDKPWSRFFPVSDAPIFLLHLRKRKIRSICIHNAVWVSPGYTAAPQAKLASITNCRDSRSLRSMAARIAQDLDRDQNQTPKYNDLTQKYQRPTHSLRDICSGAHSLVVLILRKPYFAHPRSNQQPHRVITNEKDVIRALELALPGFCILPVRFEDEPFELQVRVVRHARLLIGIHGAALTHAIFLPTKKSALLEIAPYQYSSRPHFRLLTGWRGIPYASFSSADIRSQLDDQFWIPPEELASAAKALLESTRV
eukprot:TRINITY_DN9857_c0_g1_i1.p1 TRINITY_DN9857_c0_g1~~TRINITY_DN9857_c0_g1_i1.p1  ORF type:complete len:593 (-),score=109.08 TRINITY_DN9857_c0_g1_i1:347-2125(-)